MVVPPSGARCGEAADNSGELRLKWPWTSNVGLGPYVGELSPVPPIADPVHNLILYDMALKLFAWRARQARWS